MDTCNMGVGCGEHGVCYADAHGQPDKCPLEQKVSSDNVLEAVRTGLRDPWADPVTITLSRRDARFLERHLQRPE